MHAPDAAAMDDIKRRRAIYDKIKDGVYFAGMGMPEQKKSHLCMAAIAELEKHYTLTPIEKDSAL